MLRVVPCPLPLEYQVASSQARLKSCWALPLESTVAYSSAAPARAAGAGRLLNFQHSTNQQGKPYILGPPFVLPAPLPLVLLQSWADHEVYPGSTQILVRQPAKDSSECTLFKWNKNQ
jgi:hypothetical protein